MKYAYRPKGFIEAEQFIKDSEMRVLRLLGIEKPGLEYEDEHVKFRCFQKGVCSLYLKVDVTGEVVLRPVEYGDWVLKRQDGVIHSMTDSVFRENFMCYDESLKDVEESELVGHVQDKVGEFHSIESEFQEVIEENFDDLVCKVEEDDTSEQHDQVPKIFTSYYSNPLLRELPCDEVSLVSISLYPPKGWTEKGRLHYLPLCPSESLFREVKSTGNHQKYLEGLLEQLDRLDPHQVVKDLMDMSKNKRVIVLLCYEKPQPTVGDYIWCHRCVVGEWLSSKLGVVIPELGEGHVSDILQEKSLF